MLDFKFKKKVRIKEFTEKQQDYIEKRLHERYVNILKKSSHEISYDVSLSDMNSSSLMCLVDQGSICLEEINKHYYIVYRASYQRFMIISILMSLAMGIFSMSFNFFLISIIFLFGLNWLIAHLRHDRYFISIWKGLK